ncbi:hypothetical protein CD034_01200 [Staphylococcus hominis subsp. hominis]|nr:hypothetical protein EGX58_03395 [Staphylococcus hominis]PNZ33507.1 hypothetical protein CD034_01200 [Staphylococcus hominis subsp. hominis]SUM40330.1 Uncharacterised protein [Staphylococcus hominis]
MLIVIFILFGIGIGLFIFSFFLAQNEGLAYKTISRGFSALFVSLGILMKLELNIYRINYSKIIQITDKNWSQIIKQIKIIISITFIET